VESVWFFCCPSGLRIRDVLEMWISLAACRKHPLAFKSHFTFLTSQSSPLKPIAYLRSIITKAASKAVFRAISFFDVGIRQG